MDFIDIEVKKEDDTLELEDTNQNYLKLDFEVGVKVENDSPEFGDWCLQNAQFQQPIVCEIVKGECDVKTCFICLKMFADSYSLYKHNISHLTVVLKPQQLYQCEYCLCYCTSKVNIKKHIQIKHFMNLKKQQNSVTVRDHRCLICEKMFTYKTWHGHMREVHGTEELRCGDCNITFKCVAYLRRHLLYKHGNARPSWRFHNVNMDPLQEFKCEQCPAIFRNRSSYKAHLRNCHSSQVHECLLCHSKLKSRSYLLTHMKRVHYNDGKVHKCNICHKEFRSPRYLNIHKKNSHNVRVPCKKRDHRQLQIDSSDSD